jgi:hypothetical protein
MLGNTYQEGRQAVARIRASVQSIQAAERIEALDRLTGLPSAPPAEAGADEQVLELAEREEQLQALRR